MQAERIRELIADGLQCTELDVRGPDGVHFEALVVSGAFDGKRLVERHRMVYATLGSLMGTDIHALSLDTRTPQEHAER